MIYNEMCGCWVEYLSNSAFIEKTKWCIDHFGSGQDLSKTNFTWGFRNGFIYIQDEKLATLYILRWI